LIGFDRGIKKKKGILKVVDGSEESTTFRMTGLGYLC
jgi:hypothetical protein